MSVAIAIASAVRSEHRWRRIKLAGSVSAAAGLILMGAFAAWVISLGPLPLPQAYVEDMYNPSRYGRTGTGAVEVRPAK